MRLTMRPYRDEDDFWRVRAFLRDVFERNDRRERSWQPFRFDYCVRHVYANITSARCEDVIFLWETADGRLAAVLNPESSGDVFLHTRPDAHTPELADEMLTTAEERLGVAGDGGRPRLCAWVNERDGWLRDALRRRGYARVEGPEYLRRRPLDGPVPDSRPAPAYTIRSLGDGAELLERCYASGLAFHPDDIRFAVENREDVGWYRNVQRAPLYRRDLDLVAIADDGSVASFCTIWFDDVTRTGAFEPVGTVPRHRRRGLGAALLCEGLRRLQRLGATLATVGSYGPAAHALYESVGFTDYELSEPWRSEGRPEA